LGIDLCGFEVSVTKKPLDDSDVRPLLKVVRCEAVAEGVGGDGFCNSCFLGCLLDDEVGSFLSEVVGFLVLAGLEEVGIFGVEITDVEYQFGDDFCGDWQETVFPPLCLLDMKEALLEVNILDFECHPFRDPQTATVEEGEKELVLEIRKRGEEAGNLLSGKHRRELILFLWRVENKVLKEDIFIKKLDGGQGKSGRGLGIVFLEEGEIVFHFLV